MITKLQYQIIAFIFLFTAFVPTQSWATHIVGGEMTYTCLGNDQYEIKLTVFRDCINGNPAAFFDDPAKIGIYNSLGVLIDSLFIPFDPVLNDTLDEVLSDPCYASVDAVCVHTTQYTGTKILPQIPGGYQLIYQRCCRNFSIVNIVDPLDTGATFGVNISEIALNECNSSAVFNQWPPIYICVNQPINFDQSAVDIDGDSIVYRLCTPFDGATPPTPEPLPFQQTIPQEVVWVDPPYNLSNVLGGIPLAIDEDTGLLTGTPNTLGQFVVGICLEEYRNGVLISTTRRDFQYNIGTCSVPDAAFFSPEIICEGTTVSFNNESLGATDFKWFFNDPAYPDTCSTEISPTYTFSDTGSYNIVLVANPNTNCTDTFEQDIYLQYPSLFADFDFDYVNCTDSLTIEVSDLSYDTLFEVESWSWVLVGENNEILGTSNLQNPIFVVNTSTNVELNLTITATNGCTQFLSQSFPANVFTEDSFPDEVSVCFDNEVPLNPDPLPGVTYMWSPPDGLDDPFSPTPIASPTQTTTYVVFIDNQGFCELFDTVTVVVDTINADFTAEVPCDFEVVFTNESFNADNYTWIFNDPANPNASSNIENPNFIYSDTGIYTAILIADNGAFCMDTAYQEFYIDTPLLFPDFEYDVSNCTETFDLDLTDLSVHEGGIGFEWNWTLTQDGNVIESSNAQNPSIILTESGTYEISLEMIDEDGCSSIISDTLDVQVFTPGMIPDVELFCTNDSVQLNPDPQFFGVTYLWMPPDGLSNINAASPMALPDQSTTYFVDLSNQYGCMFTDTVELIIDNSFEPPLEGMVEFDTIRPGDTTQIFTTEDPDYIYEWESTNTLSDLGIADPLAFPEETTTYTLSIEDENGCTNTIQFLVVVQVGPCDDPNIFLPNAFTPNGDGENDVLRLMGNSIEEMQLVIYNRWGQKIFESFDQNVGWDGTFKGKRLPPDSYGFYLIARCVGGEEYYKKGNITLLK